MPAVHRADVGHERAAGHGDGRRIRVARTSTVSASGAGALTPQFRYYRCTDPFGQFPPFVFGNNKPVGMNTGSNIWKNIDPPPTGSDGFNTFPYQGNLRSTTTRTPPATSDTLTDTLRSSLDGSRTTARCLAQVPCRTMPCGSISW